MARISSRPPQRMPDSVRVRTVGLQHMDSQEFLKACKGFSCVEYTPMDILGNAFEAYGYLQVLADPIARGILDDAGLAETFARNQAIEMNFDLNVSTTHAGHKLIVLKHEDVLCFMANPRNLELVRQMEIIEVAEAEAARDSEWPNSAPPLDEQEGGNLLDGPDAQPLLAKTLLRRGPFEPQEGLRGEVIVGPRPSDEIGLEAKPKKPSDS